MGSGSGQGLDLYFRLYLLYRGREVGGRRIPRQPGQVRKEAALTSLCGLPVQPLTFYLLIFAPPRLTPPLIPYGLCILVSKRDILFDIERIILCTVSL